MLLPQKSQHDPFVVGLFFFKLLLFVLRCLDFSAAAFALKTAFAFEAQQVIREAPEGEPWDALRVSERERTLKPLFTYRYRRLEPARSYRCNLMTEWQILAHKGNEQV